MSDLKDIPDVVVETLGLDTDDGVDRSQYGSNSDSRSGSESGSNFSFSASSPLKEPPLLTFRYFLLSVLFVIPGAFIDTLNSFRTTSAPYGVLLVQLLAYPLGKWLSQVLPNREIGFSHRWSFNLNPGPWSVKESVLVTLTAASGATGNQGTVGLSLAKVFYDIDIPAWVAIVFMHGIVWTGYSFGAIARQFVLYNPKYVWPKALMQTSLFKAQSCEHCVEGKSRMRIFTIALLGMFLWQFMPEMIFPLTSSLAVLCWMAPYSKALNFAGSGLGGLGMLNISLDWSNITSDVMLSPYWTIVLQFAGFVLTCWVFLPFCKWILPHHFSVGLMDNHLLLQDGGRYPIAELITDDMKFNQTAYEYYGPINFGAQRLFNIFYDYAAYTSALAWIITFGWDDLKAAFSTSKTTKGSGSGEITLMARSGSDSSTESTALLKTEHDDNSEENLASGDNRDRITKMYSVYDDIPTYWFVVLFLLSFIALSYITWNGYVFMPWRTYIVALLVGAVIVTPMAYLYATSNFQLAIGTFNELLYGIMVQHEFFLPANGVKHPVGATMYGAIAGNCWYRAQYILQDQKIGMYNMVPPKYVFFSQIFGDLLGVPFNYMALKWVLKSKIPYLRGEKEDPLHQWTGQSLVNYSANATQYVLVGPKELFRLYGFLPYGFLLGILVPCILYLIYKRTHSRTISHMNSTILFSTMSTFFGNVSTGYLSKFLLGSYTMFYLQRFKMKVFQKYNYVVAAAFDTGFNLCNIMVFALSNSGYLDRFPHWWGNDATNIEKCYALF